ncbi:uracil-DNA glycosylase [Roseivivax halodurans JCM 10272]|uniref:Uracil-DNA glycosylase n=1 Tax=Roseivivax halodurans JCM 10272 TaxID=1449350 RepID=X7EHN0_9RHOB|nr:uracil-DNA glycosylase [Roseivivax halodurans]ETX14648.1 uracil-DNA glycosylase [Roseivivax halodurans JCM 10272]
MTPPPAWAHLRFFRERLPQVEAALAADDRAILPPAHQTFAALEALPPEEVRVVILGQDPYPTAGHAHGHAFSVEPDVRPLPRSLANIFKEMEDDVGASPEDGDLRGWAREGVLLLNTALTVPEGAANGHAKLGWSELAKEILAELSQSPRAFILWGGHAKSFCPFISGADHLIVSSSHPSPLSARRGFFGSRPFSRVNHWLRAKGDREINWMRT